MNERTVKTYFARATQKENNMSIADKCFEDNSIRLGWYKLGDLRALDRDEIKEKLREFYPNEGKTEMEVGNMTSVIDMFVNKIQPGDLILLPDGDTYHIGQITGGYKYQPNQIEKLKYFPHMHPVKWLKDIAKEKTPKEIRTQLKNRRTVGRLNGCDQIVNDIVIGSYEPTTTITAEYPLRDNYKVIITVPSDMTKVEAERLGAFVKTLYYDI